MTNLFAEIDAMESPLDRLESQLNILFAYTGTSEIDHDMGHINGLLYTMVLQLDEVQALHCKLFDANTAMRKDAATPQAQATVPAKLRKVA